MSSEIIVALLGFIGTASGSMLGAFTSSKLTNYRLEQLEKKVDSLNDYGQRIALLEKGYKDYEKRVQKLEEKV